MGTRHRSRVRPGRRAHGWLLAAVAGLAACAGDPRIPDEFAWEDTAAEQSTPLSGENLSQMRREMQRAHRDLGHFHTTLRDLRDRSDSSGHLLLSSFLGAYLGLHLDPLLAGEWQSRHPELVALDANLRLAKAEVLIQMRETARVQQVIEELETRYAGRESMLVEFPLGSRSSLGDAIQALRDRKWRG